jgi:tRNA(Ile)-lysidine synthase
MSLGKLTHPLPKQCIVAVSGGVDSVAALHFLSQVKSRVTGVIHINHATGQFADDAEELVRRTCENQRIDLTVRTIQDQKEGGDSLEDFWRAQRYRFFEEEAAGMGPVPPPIVLAHNMDDCLEEYVICTMLRGYLGTIPYQHGPCIRPFRLWKRRDIERFAAEHRLRWLEDPSNSDSKFLRAGVRRLLTPRIRFINPGIYSIVEKAIKEQDERGKNEGP